MKSRQTGEFERIERIFAPLAAAWPGALGLRDDAALVRPSPGCELVVTMDTIVAGVHFIGDEAADAIAQKLLRVNLSDLAAMGARPLVYTLSIALPDSVADEWLEEFARGLAVDQQTFGITLAGGDSVATPGSITLTVTAIGEVGADMALCRSGARVGDGLFVTGTVGDGALGLRVARNELAHLDAKHREALLRRYRYPKPRLEVGRALIGLASAVVDISDGLVADLRHVAAASDVGATVAVTSIPLSAAAAAAVSRQRELIEAVLAGGDDYELLFTVPPENEAGLTDLSDRTGVPITRIGDVVAGAGVRVVDEDGTELKLRKSGYTHG